MVRNYKDSKFRLIYGMINIQRVPVLLLPGGIQCRNLWLAGTPDSRPFKKLPGCCRAQFEVLNKRLATSVY
jgi:hypothetical protein